MKIKTPIETRMVGERQAAKEKLTEYYHAHHDDEERIHISFQLTDLLIGDGGETGYQCLQCLVIHASHDVSSPLSVDWFLTLSLETHNASYRVKMPSLVELYCAVCRIRTPGYSVHASTVAWHDLLRSANLMPWPWPLLFQLHIVAQRNQIQPHKTNATLVGDICIVESHAAEIRKCFFSVSKYELAA